MRDPHAVSSEQVKTSSSQVQQRVVGKFLRQNDRRSIRVLELAARRNSDKNQSIVGCVQNSVGAPVIIARSPHEDLRPALDFLTELQHAALQLPLGGGPRLWRVDMTH